jgi:hypothetical protein
MSCTVWCVFDVFVLQVKIYPYMWSYKMLTSTALHRKPHQLGIMAENHHLWQAMSVKSRYLHAVQNNYTAVEINIYSAVHLFMPRCNYLHRSKNDIYTEVQLFIYTAV